jgi:cardiolipin synthase
MTGIFKVAKNQLMLLQNGADFFPQLCTDIDAAQHSIYLETYIFAADDIGRLVADALQQAAGRGVTVRVLLDGYGSAQCSGTGAIFPRSPLAAAGCAACVACIANWQ